MKFRRSAGVLLHPTSLPGNGGIGTLGEDARKFLAFMRDCGLSLWQTCPLGPTGYGNSPYQSFSAFAGNPLLIDLNACRLEPSELAVIPDLPEDRVDYPAVIEYKIPLLKKAAAREQAALDGDAVLRQALAVFEEKSRYWLDDYAFFMALKEHFGNGPWSDWPEDIRRRHPHAMEHYRARLAREITLHRMMQFIFYTQWKKLKAEADGIKFVGDIPIFVAFDSADAWAHPELFELDDSLMPLRVAGVPPDYFCKTGQLWGNPVYDWAACQREGFRWWIERFRTALLNCDIVRIDHFRGFESCWAIPADHETAEHGSWEPALGAELFQALREALGELPIIAEDLGVITPEVEYLRDSNDFPGMKVLQFAFDSNENNDFLPHNYTANSVVYTGTHDNDTTRGWYASASRKDKHFARLYLDARSSNFVIKMIRTAWASVSALAIAPMQDFLDLDSEARMNLPGTTGGNWEWRFGWQMIEPELKKHLRELTETYRRTVA